MFDRKFGLVGHVRGLGVERIAAPIQEYRGFFLVPPPSLVNPSRDRLIYKEWRWSSCFGGGCATGVLGTGLMLVLGCVKGRLVVVVVVVNGQECRCFCCSSCMAVDKNVADNSVGVD